MIRAGAGRFLVRDDGAGCTKAFLAHVRSLREQAVACGFSVGWTITGREHTAIALLAERDWNAAVQHDRQLFSQGRSS